MTAREREAMIRSAWAAAWDRGDVDVLDELLDADYRRIGDGHVRDREQFKATIRDTRAAFPELVTTIDEILVDGDRAAIRWHSAGTHEHSYLGVPATGRRVAVSGATFARFVDDRIVDEHVTWDPRALLAGLGIHSIGRDR